MAVSDFFLNVQHTGWELMAVNLAKQLGVHLLNILLFWWASLVAQLVKNPPAVQETWVWSLGWEDPLKKGKVTHSSILTWRIPWTVWVGHNWATFISLLILSTLLHVKFWNWNDFWQSHLKSYPSHLEGLSIVFSGQPTSGALGCNEWTSAHIIFSKHFSAIKLFVKKQYFLLLVLQYTAVPPKYKQGGMLATLGCVSVCVCVNVGVH